MELDLRRQTGALMIAVQRGLSLLEQPDPHVNWEPGDVVFLAGTGESLRKATQMLSEPVLPLPAEPGEGQG